MVTVEQRDKAEAAAKAALEAGDLLTAGKRLTDLAFIFKHIHPSDGGNGWTAAAACGLKAIECLRQCDDELALARALRATSQVHFIEGIDHKALADEAMEISRRLDDNDEIAWSLLRESNQLLFTPESSREDQLRLFLEALERFESSGNNYGQGIVLQTLAIQYQEGRERLGSILRAALLFREAAQEENAIQADQIALMLCDNLIGFKSQRKMLTRVLKHYRQTRQRDHAALAYRRLKKLNSPPRHRSRYPSL